MTHLVQFSVKLEQTLVRPPLLPFLTLLFAVFATLFCSFCGSEGVVGERRKRRFPNGDCL